MTCGSWRRRELLLATGGLAAGLLVPLTRAAAQVESGVAVSRQEPSIGRREFDPRRPPSDMPKLTPPESGVCDFTYSLAAGVDYAYEPLNATSMQIQVDELDLETTLGIMIWTARNSPPKLIAHEEGHRLICEYCYANADIHARAAGLPVIGAQYVGNGRNQQEAQQDAVRQVLAELDDAYMGRTRVRCSAAQQRFDAITRHSLNDVPELEAIAQAVASDPEPPRG